MKMPDKWYEAILMVLAAAVLCSAFNFLLKETVPPQVIKMECPEQSDDEIGGRYYRCLRNSIQVNSGTCNGDKCEINYKIHPEWSTSNNDNTTVKISEEKQRCEKEGGEIEYQIEYTDVNNGTSVKSGNHIIWGQEFTVTCTKHTPSKILFKEVIN